ncbi:phage tail protein [Yersinia kristensenii]|uniref:phage tail protein n=1 Tax=Yersinia kristensenii TaxID=28152 RepID=UPI0011A17388|nr:phage tail protein [Yersinia kristensenii]
MTVKYFALLTNLGAAKLANATALGTQLQITHMAVGDGGGTLPIPNAAQTQLISEKRRAALNSLSIDAANTSQIIAEQVIPETDGGWWIREVGLFDKDGVLIAIANCPETYKPQLQEGSGRTQTVRMVLIVSSTEAVTLKIDPSVVLATRKYVDDKVIEVKQYADNLLTEHEKSRNHPDASLTAKGFAQYSSSTNSDSENLAATSKAVNTVAKAAVAAMSDHAQTENPHPQYLIPVGIPLPWSTATPPAGWIKCNGNSFNKTTYPKLALAYPSGVLPDLRGEFIRGWDDGRGADAARTLLSAQSDAMRNLTGSFGGTTNNDACSVLGGGTGIFAGGTTLVNPMNGTGIGANTRPVTMTLDASRQVQTSTENRPRNIAFNYIVRAA